MDKDKKFLEVKKNTKNIYEINAKAFDEQREKKLFEKAWLDRFIKLVPENGSILDVGCGAGDPIAKYFIKKGFQVVGLDISESMISIAKKRFPNFKWLLHDMKDFDLETKFDGIIAWNSFFHLDHDDQKKSLLAFSKHLNPYGILMFTAGPENSEVLGTVNGHDVYHSSFSFDEYKDILSSLGLSVIDYKLDDPDCQGHSIYLIQSIN